MYHCFQAGDSEGVTNPKLQTLDDAADTVNEADSSSGLAAPAPAACPVFEDTDSCHTGLTSGEGRRGSEAMSGGENVSTTVITVTEPSPCQSPERTVAQSRQDDVKEWVILCLVCWCWYEKV